MRNKIYLYAIVKLAKVGAKVDSKIEPEALEISKWLEMEFTVMENK